MYPPPLPLPLPSSMLLLPLPPPPPPPESAGRGGVAFADRALVILSQASACRIEAIVCTKKRKGVWVGGGEDEEEGEGAREAVVCLLVCTASEINKTDDVPETACLLLAGWCTAIVGCVICTRVFGACVCVCALASLCWFFWHSYEKGMVCSLKS